MHETKAWTQPICPEHIFHCSQLPNQHITYNHTIKYCLNKPNSLQSKRPGNVVCSAYLLYLSVRSSLLPDSSRYLECIQKRLHHFSHFRQTRDLALCILGDIIASFSSTRQMKISKRIEVTSKKELVHFGTWWGEISRNAQVWEP